MVQQIFNLNFPNNAKNIKTATNAFGKSIFYFEMEDISNGFNYSLIAGTLLIIIGTVLMLLIYFKNRL